MRLLGMALLFFGLSSVGHAADVSLSKADFVSAHSSAHGTEVLVLADFSSAGLAKRSRLNDSVGSEIDVNLAGEVHHFRLRVPLKAAGLQMGPFSAEEAKRVVDAININQ